MYRQREVVTGTWVWNTTSSDSGASRANKLRQLEGVTGGGASTTSRTLVNATMPTSVTKTQNADGTYTVVAQFPPCPADTTHATGS